MKYLVGFSRIFVGILFIISGFIKLNDPVGFSFKLEEYFSSGVLDLPFFEPHALLISIIVVVFEVLVGVMLLIGYQSKFTVWSLLIMIIGFTFLTFYSAYFNKVTDCGCFGDAIKLTPWESFTKDIVLLVLIVILFIGRKHILPAFSLKTNRLIVFIALVLSGFYVYHVLNHLPVIDFRPFEIGKNIEEGMTVPEDAPKAIYDYAWKFNMVIAYDLRKTNVAKYAEVKRVTDIAIKKGYKVIGMSASNNSQTSKIIEENSLRFPFYFTDETALKTIVRSNPAILVLEKGTIKQKVHYNDFDALEF